MTETCDLCHSSALEPIYEPTASKRGLTVYLCSDCGLVQSLPRVAAPCIGDRKNDRNVQALRSEACLSLIRAHADSDSSFCVLYAGSNRGSFARAMFAAASEATLTCVEPDEDIRLPDAHFDIVHSCGTIEQRVSPVSTLADYWRALKPDGLLIIDAPNIVPIDSDDIVEEWFIDNHLYHFSHMTLSRLLEASGFEIIVRPDPKDRENLLFAARKSIKPARLFARDPAEVDVALALITSYVTARARVQRAA
jgi:SAM-dependent methyltransferase